MTNYKTIHGTLLTINTRGVLLIGASGLGKTDCALELVMKGHSFVADDVVHVYRDAHTIIGKPDPGLQARIHVRGIGIVDLATILKPHQIKEMQEIHVVVEFVPRTSCEHDLVLGDEEHKYEVLDAKIPLITLPITPTRHVATLIELVSNMNLHLTQHSK